MVNGNKTKKRRKYEITFLFQRLFSINWDEIKLFF